MALFSIYTYQFSPVIDGDLFSEVLFERKKIMSQKNTVFERIIKETKYVHRNKILSAQLIFIQGDIIAFRLANRKTVRLEKKFQEEVEINEPSSLVIIYNSSFEQRIAIEQNTNAFSETEVVAKILRNSFVKVLKRFNLSITIRKEYQKQEFWSFVQEHTENIEMLRFEFDYPNLPRVSKCIEDLIKDVSEETLSTKTRFELNSGENNNLKITEDNNQITNLAKASSESGNPIIMKVKGYKSFFKTGKTTRTVELDEVEVEAKNIEDIKNVFHSLDNE